MPTRESPERFGHAGEEAERVASLKSLEIVGGSNDGFLDELVESVASRFGMSIAQVNFVDTNRQWTMAAFGTERGGYIDRDICFCAHTIQEPDKLTIVGDARKDTRFSNNPLVIGAPWIRFYAGACLKDADGRAIGALCVADTESHSPASIAAADLAELARIVSSRLDYYRVKAALRESEDNYRFFYDLNPLIPFTTTPDGQVEEKNPSRWLSLVGQSHGKPSGDGWQRAVHPDDQAATMAAWRVALRSGQPLDTEYRLCHDDGEYLWFRARAAPRRNASGAIVRWYGALENIDDHKRANLALWRSEQKLRFAMEAGGLGSWDLDLQSGTVTVSEVCARHLGVAGVALITSRENWLAALHKGDRARHRGDLDRAAKRVEMLDSNYRIAARDGTGWIRISGQVIRVSEGLRIVGITQDVTEQLRADTRPQHVADDNKYEANHDDLTGLPNHRALDLMLSKAADADARATTALILANLDNFKSINDKFGTTVGDKLLRQVALRLNRYVRDLVEVARVGGDEFAVLQTTMNGVGAADDLASDILNALEEPFELGGNRISLSCTMGISFTGRTADGAYDLKRAASAALHKAKMTRRGEWLHFLPAMALEMEQDLALRRDMLEALAQSEFELLYQPFIHLGTGRIEGFDALLRWRHPTRGLLAPEAFLAVAEDTGWIVSIGRWALGAACREAAGWGSSMKVAVKLSALQFSLSDLEADVTYALDSSGLASSRLELEVAGPSMAANRETVIPVLLSLKRLGTNIVLGGLDDAQAASICLQEIPFDKVKVGPALAAAVPDVTNATTSASKILALAKVRGVATVATGIESAAQVACFSLLKCDQAQGRYFSKPVPASALPAIIEQSGAGRQQFGDQAQ